MLKVVSVNWGENFKSAKSDGGDYFPKEKDTQQVIYKLLFDSELLLGIRELIYNITLNDPIKYCWLASMYLCVSISNEKTDHDVNLFLSATSKIT